MSDWGGKRKGAGRPQGRLNNKTSDLIERLEKKYPNWCPIEHLATIANDKKTPLDIQIQCCNKIASYIYSKPKITIESDVQMDLAARIIAGRKRAGIIDGD